jgi:hypothetical protein
VTLTYAEEPIIRAAKELSRGVYAAQAGNAAHAEEFLPRPPIYKSFYLRNTVTFQYWRYSGVAHTLQSRPQLLEGGRCWQPSALSREGAPRGRAAYAQSFILADSSQLTGAVSVETHTVSTSVGCSEPCLDRDPRHCRDARLTVLPHMS